MSDQLDDVCNQFRSIRSCSSRILAIVDDVQQLAQIHSDVVHLDTTVVRPCLEKLFHLLFGACVQFKSCVSEEDLMGYCPRLSSLSKETFEELVQELIKDEQLGYKKLKVRFVKFEMIRNTRSN